MEGADKSAFEIENFERNGKNGIRPEWMFMTVLPVLPA